jgi:hypothetical protein
LHNKGILPQILFLPLLFLLPLLLLLPFIITNKHGFYRALVDFCRYRAHARNSPWLTGTAKLPRVPPAVLSAPITSGAGFHLCQSAAPMK